MNGVAWRFLVLVGSCFSSSQLFAQVGQVSAAQPAAPVAVAAPATGAAAVDAAAAREDVLFGKGSLTWKQRRELGLTFGGIAKAARQAHAKGDLEEGMSRSEMAAAVLNELSAQNPKAYGDAAIDLDGILQFIESLLPLILTLINLWSWMPTNPMPMYACAMVMGVFVSRFRRAIN